MGGVGGCEEGGGTKLCTFWAQPKNRASGTPSELQGRLLSILAHYPTTADSAQSCLLCYQPEPVPRTLAARVSQFTLSQPCRLPAW